MPEATDNIDILITFPNGALVENYRVIVVPLDGFSKTSAF